MNIKPIYIIHSKTKAMSNTIPEYIKEAAKAEAAIYVAEYLHQYNIRYRQAGLKDFDAGFIAGATSEVAKRYAGYKNGEGDSSFLDLAAMSESSIHEESFEIIGNIYENPELINP